MIPFLLLLFLKCQRLQKKTRKEKNNCLVVSRPKNKPIHQVHLQILAVIKISCINIKCPWKLIFDNSRMKKDKKSNYSGLTGKINLNCLLWKLQLLKSTSISRVCHKTFHKQKKKQVLQNHSCLKDIKYIKLSPWTFSQFNPKEREKFACNIR